MHAAPICADLAIWIARSVTFTSLQLIYTPVVVADLYAHYLVLVDVDLRLFPTADMCRLPLWCWPDGCQLLYVTVGWLRFPRYVTLPVVAPVYSRWITVTLVG